MVRKSNDKKLFKGYDKIINSDNYEKIIFFLLFIGFVITIIAFTIGNLYNQPSADDYIFAVQTKKVLVESGSIIEVFKQVWRTTIDIYLNWQGTFFGNLLLALNPMIYSMEFYKIIAFVYQIIFYFSVFVFMFTFFGKIFNVKLRTILLIYFTYFLITLNYMPEIGDWYYWYTGLVAYTIPFSLMLLLFSIVFNILNSRKNNEFKLAIMLSVVGVLVAGTQVITSLVSWFALAIVIIVLIYSKSSKRKYILYPFIIYTIAFIVSVISPGNFVRASSYEQIGAINSILLSFLNSFTTTIEFFKVSPILLVTVLLVPIFVFESKKMNFKFKYPLLVIFVLIIWYTSNYTPTIFATGTLWMDSRVKDIIYFTFILSWFIGVFYITGWITKKELYNFNAVKLIVICSLVVLILGIIQLKINNIRNVNTIKIATEIKNGTLIEYDRQIKNLYRNVESDDDKEFIVDRITVAPSIYHNFFISPDKEHWVNQGLADYFGKKYIWVKEEY